MIHYTKNEPGNGKCYYACFANKQFVGTISDAPSGEWVFHPFGPHASFTHAELFDISQKLSSLNINQDRGRVDELEACTAFTPNHPPKP